MLEVLGILFLVGVLIYATVVTFGFAWLHYAVLPYIRAEAYEGASAEGYEQAG